MVKESDIPIKKRRKTATAPADVSVEPPVVVPLKQEISAKAENVDLYQSVVDYESKEALARDPDDDHTLYIKTCNDFRKIANEIGKLKTQKGNKSNAEIAELRTQGALLFVVLKKLNRLEKFRTKDSRESLNKVKQRVDSDHLQLQNLNYEMLHLKMEVNKCLKFKSKDEEIELVPVDEFFKESPAKISRSAITKKDEHQLKLARLEWELQQRKDISSQCQQLEEKRREADKEIVAQTARLDNLRPQLDGILEVTKPLQEFFNMPLDKIRKHHQLARLLPVPLYVLYVRADSYKKACDSTVSVVLKGDEDAARLLATEIQPAMDDESDSEQENSQAQEEDEDGRRRKVSTRVDRQAERRKLLLRLHPLAVEVTLRLPDGNAIHITFSHLTNLALVTAQPRVDSTQAIHGIAAAELIAAHRILSVLLPGEQGEAACDAASAYRLRRAGLDGLPAELGLPYAWAQRLAGAEAVANDTAVGSDTLFRRIKRRLDSRLSLCRQIQQLEAGLVAVNHAMRSIFPAKLSSALREFTPLVWEDYVKFPHTHDLVADKISEQTDTFYKAVLARGTAKLTALLTVKADYPAAQAVFCLHIHWVKELTARNCNAIRDMERELNVYGSEYPPLLSAQVMRLQASFDIFLESSSAMLANNSESMLLEFPRDKVFFRAVRGRDRSMPFKYLQAGGGVFTHR